MKKFIIPLRLFILTMLLSLLSCDRELEYSSDFKFIVNNIDDQEIFINTSKPFSLEITELRNIIENQNYSFRYQVTSGTLIVKDGTVTLIEGNEYDFSIDSDNRINLELIPQSEGTLTVKFFLKDNNGVEQEKEVLVYCNDQDYNFQFTGAVPNANGTVSQQIPFSLTLTNTGLSANIFQLKYSSNLSGNLSINSTIYNQNQFYQVNPGTIQGIYQSNVAGQHDLVFTVRDVSGTERTVNLTINIAPTPFVLTKLSDFSVKNTKSNQFQFTLANTLVGASYQIKFTSNQSCSIYQGTGTTTSVPMNTWLNLTLIGSNLYTYTYLANSDVNDNLSVEIKDNYNQTQTIVFNITVFPKPTFNGNIIFTRNTPNQTSLGNWNCSFNTKSNINPTLTGGATLSKTKIIIKNKLTGNFDTYEYSNTLLIQTLETGGGTSSGWNASSLGAQTSAYNNSKYAGQLYSMQIQDSDGVWSNVFNGTVITN